MSRVLQSSWLTALVGCLLYLAVTLALLKPAQFAGARAALAARAKMIPDDEPSWKFTNPEMDQWIESIRHERQALTLRQQQLHDLQARLDAERQELNVVTQTVYQLQADFDKNVVRFKRQQAANLQHQAQLFAAMSPSGAAALIAQMPDDDAVRILFTMKSDAASAVLEALGKTGAAGAARAAALTERMSRALPPDPSAH